MRETELPDEQCGRPLGPPPGGVGTVLGRGLVGVGALAAGFGLPLILNGEVEVGGPVFSFGVAVPFMEGSHPVDWRVLARWVLIPAPVAFLAGLAWVVMHR